MTKKYEREIRELLEKMDDRALEGRPGKRRRPWHGGLRPPRGLVGRRWRPKAVHLLAATLVLAVAGYALARADQPFAPYVSLASFLCLLGSLAMSVLQRRIRHASTPIWRGRIIKLPRRHWWQFWMRNGRPRKRRDH